MDFYTMPKIDLHCHLDGSMELLSTQKMLRELGEEYSLEELKKRFGICVTLQNEEVAEFADIIILAVKPNLFSQVISGIRDVVCAKKEDKLVVSIAAGKSIDAIRGFILSPPFSGLPQTR